jgi:iron complex transport system ATP-binding protein
MIPGQVPWIDGRRAGRTEIVAALRGLAAIGPHFAVDVRAVDVRAVDVRATPTTVRPDAPPVTDLYQAGPALADAVDDIAARIGSSERRVAASTLFLGYAARLWSITIGCWATTGLIPDLPAHHLYAELVPDAPIRLELTDPGGWQPDDTADQQTLAEIMFDTVVGGHLRPLVTAVRAEARVATGLLWGNAASAVVGVAHVLDRHAAPTAGRDARLVAAHLLALPPLAGTTRFTCSPDGRLELRSVVRRSCCLFYRVPGGGTCGDCPLTGRPAPSGTAR